MTKIIEQFYAPYWEWEDFNNKMYSDIKEDNEDILINKCKELFTNTDLFYSTGLLVLQEWPISSKINMTNLSINRRAWVGCAICNYKTESPEYVVRIAWKSLTEYDRIVANKIATKLIEEYEGKNFGLHKKMGGNGLF